TISSRGTPMISAADWTRRWSSRAERSRRWYSSTISLTRIPCSGFGAVRARMRDCSVWDTGPAWQSPVGVGIGGIPEPSPERRVRSALSCDDRGERGTGPHAELVVDPGEMRLHGLLDQ